MAVKKVSASKAKKATTKKKVASKTVAAKKAKKKVSANSKSSAVGKKTNGSKIKISASQRQKMIGEAAYHVSSKREPDQGYPDLDWIQAETVIDLFFEAS